MLTVSINLLFMNEHFHLFDLATEQSIIASNSLQHVNTLHFYHFIKTNLLLPNPNPTYCHMRVHKAVSLCLPVWMYISTYATIAWLN